MIISHCAKLLGAFCSANKRNATNPSAFFETRGERKHEFRIQIVNNKVGCSCFVVNVRVRCVDDCVHIQVNQCIHFFSGLSFEVHFGLPD